MDEPLGVLTHNQIRAIERMDTVLGYAVFDDPGVGKTRIAVESINRYAVRDGCTAILVVVPAQCRSVWDDPILSQLNQYARFSFELNAYTGARVRSRWSHSFPDNDNPDPVALSVLVTSYESLRRESGFMAIYEALKPHRDAYWTILDESHKSKSTETRQYRTVNAITKYARRITLLSGSPVDRSNADIHAPMQILNRVNGNLAIRAEDIDLFKDRYCKQEGRIRLRRKKNERNDHYAERVAAAEFNQEQDTKRAAERMARVYGPYMQTTRIVDVWELPPSTHSTIDVPLLPTTWKTYCRAMDDLILDIKTQENPDGVVINNSLIALTKAAAICAGHLQHDNNVQPNSFEKVSAALEWIKRQSHPDSFVLWTRFRHEADLLQAFLRMQVTRGEIPPSRIYAIVGGQSAKERARVVRSMKHHDSEDSVICVCNLGAGQHGVDLTAACNSLYLSLEFGATKYRQTLARVLRKGQERPVSFSYLIATPPPGYKTKSGGTVDRLIYDTVTRNTRIQDMTRQEWARVVEGLV